MRHQLKDSPIKVFEVIPPIVDTELDKGSRDGRGMSDRGILPKLVADEVFAAMEKNGFEIAVGMAKNRASASNEEREHIFKRMNRE